MTPSWAGIGTDAVTALMAGFGIAEAVFILVFAFTLLVWMLKKLIYAAF